MWCVIHVGGGNEARAEAFVSGLLPEGLGVRCFHLVRSRRKKYGGRWQTVRENLMPGYVFIDADQPEALCRKLKKVPGHGLLFSDADFVTTLGKQETDFLECVADGGGGIGISRVGVDSGGGVRYLSGPLAEISHLVRRVDLHRRVAEIEAGFTGEGCVLYLGIEIEGRDAPGDAPPGAAPGDASLGRGGFRRAGEGAPAGMRVRYCGGGECGT